MIYLLYFYSSILIVIWIIGFLILGLGAIMHIVPTIGAVLLIRTKVNGKGTDVNLKIYSF